MTTKTKEIKIPEEFDGNEFIKKFGVTEADFRIDGDNLICEKLPNLKTEDITDCVVDWDKYYSSHLARNIKKDRHPGDKNNIHRNYKDVVTTNESGPR